MDGLSSGSRIGNSLSEALGLVGQSPERVAQDQWRQQESHSVAVREPSQPQEISGARLAAAERAGESGELHPRGRFLNLKV